MLIEWFEDIVARAMARHGMSDGVSPAALFVNRETSTEKSNDENPQYEVDSTGVR